MAIVGPTGSGKSTLVYLIAGLRKPDAGVIRLDDKPTDDWPPALLRASVLLIPQEGHVIKGSLADNLRMVPGRHSDQELIAAIDRAGLDRWVATLPGGLETTIDSQGSNLSAGERQLIALTRAALADPALLILDEATADIDPVTERHVTAALDAVSRGRTVITVAHRAATVASADRIFEIPVSTRPED